ncbi:MAG: helix-turn-helix transcriptional regulator [Pseudobutyrivibrio ruminis]|nr:helix-turn-helix transcriptional regulator [Pseudobutyrivibrio ruminis]
MSTKSTNSMKPFHCPVEATFSQIGGKYKMIILYHLLHDGVLRYNQIQKYIPQATAKMLAQQLRELEADDLVHREVYPVVPPKTEYSLTERGISLKPVIDAICDWGREYMAGTFDE